MVHNIKLFDFYRTPDCETYGITSYMTINSNTNLLPQFRKVAVVWTKNFIYQYVLFLEPVLHSFQSVTYVSI